MPVIQTTLDLSNKPRSGIFEKEKKVASCTFKCSQDLLDMIDRVAPMMGTTRSEYCEYVMSESVGNDIAKILLIKARSNKALKDLL